MKTKTEIKINLNNNIYKNMTENGKSTYQNLKNNNNKILKL